MENLMTIEQKLLESLQNGEATGKTIMESISSLFEGEEFTDDFKAKASAIFESAVVNKAKSMTDELESIYESKYSELESSYETKHEELSSIYESKFDELETTFETKFIDFQQVNEAVFNKQHEALSEQIDGYLDYASQSWIDANKVAVESGLKSEIVEGFITNMKGLFESSYIDLPSAQLDVVKELTEENETLKAQLKETVDSTIKYKREIESTKRSAIIEEFTSALTLVEADKFRELASELSFTDNDKFRTKLHTITEHYFKKDTKPTGISPVTDTPVLTEEFIVTPTSSDSNVSAYVAALSRYTN
jgi:hypothetical protein